MKLMVLGKLKFDGDMKKADLLMPLFDEKTLVNTFSQAVPAGILGLLLALTLHLASRLGPVVRLLSLLEIAAEPSLLE